MINDGRYRNRESDFPNRYISECQDIQIRPLFSSSFPSFSPTFRAPFCCNGRSTRTLLISDVILPLSLVIVPKRKLHHIFYGFSGNCGCCSNMVTAPRLPHCVRIQVMFVCFIRLLIMYTDGESGTDVCDIASTPVVSEVRIGMLMPTETSK